MMVLVSFYAMTEPERDLTILIGTEEHQIRFVSQGLMYRCPEMKKILVFSGFYFLLQNPKQPWQVWNKTPQQKNTETTSGHKTGSFVFFKFHQTGSGLNVNFFAVCC